MSKKSLTKSELSKFFT
jgi:hypothetical protein